MPAVVRILIGAAVSAGPREVPVFHDAMREARADRASAALQRADERQLHAPCRAAATRLARRPAPLAGNAACARALPRTADD
jgi:hypothetical protein